MQKTHAGCWLSEMKQITSGIAFILLLLAACNLAVQPTPPTPLPQPTAHSAEATEFPDWLAVYFTNPAAAGYPKNGLDQVIVAAIEGATQSVDVSSFEYDLPSVTNALVRAHQRGVQVRMVLDLDHGLQMADKDGPDKESAAALKTLQQANLPLVDGSRESGLMHDKMILVDGQVLFTGSWNITYSDTFSNNNNLLKITDPRLIANYQAKFNELFVAQRYGNLAEVGAQTPVLDLQGVRVENYFSPPDSVMQKILHNIQTARQSIRFMAYTFTYQDLAQAMINRAETGVLVSGVVDARSAYNGALKKLACAGLPIKIDGNRYALHHKVIIIDESTVITGSFNFTLSADTINDENILIIHHPGVARLYLEEYARVEALGTPPDSTHINCDNPK